jgi:hypothetical protein
MSFLNINIYIYRDKVCIYIYTENLLIPCIKQTNKKKHNVFSTFYFLLKYIKTDFYVYICVLVLKTGYFLKLKSILTIIIMMMFDLCNSAVANYMCVCVFILLLLLLQLCFHFSFCLFFVRFLSFFLIQKFKAHERNKLK